MDKLPEDDPNRDTSKQNDKKSFKFGRAHEIARYNLTDAHRDLKLTNIVVVSEAQHQDLLRSYKGLADAHIQIEEGTRVDYTSDQLAAFLAKTKKDAKRQPKRQPINARGIASFVEAFPMMPRSRKLLKTMVADQDDRIRSYSKAGKRIKARMQYMFTWLLIIWYFFGHGIVGIASAAVAKMLR